MIKVIKIGNLIYQNIEPKHIDENGNEIWNPNIPQDIDSLKSCFKDTLDWLTTRHINQKLQEIQEDLSDISTEQSWLEGVFYSQGLDPNQIKAEITKVVLGQEDVNTAITNLAIPDELVDNFNRAVEIAKIIAWKEQVWKTETQLEAQIDAVTDIDELLLFDVNKLCEEAYNQIPLEV